MDMVSIYMLEYSDIDKIYIGSTVDTKGRLRQHELYGTSHIQDMDPIRCGRKVAMHILEVVRLEERLFWECFYMDLFKMFGFELKNTHRIINTNKIYHLDMPKYKTIRK